MGDEHQDIGKVIAKLETSKEVVANLKLQTFLRSAFLSEASHINSGEDVGKFLEAILQEGEEMFNYLANHAPVLIWIAGLDKGCFYFNQPWLNFTGRTLEQEQGNGWAEGVHPDDFDRCWQTYVEAFDARQPFTMEYRLRNRGGEYRWLLDNGVPRLAPDGEFLGYIGSCIDITERYEARQAIEESEEKYRSLVESINTIIVRWLPTGEITFANEYCHNFFGFSKEEMVGKSVFDTIVPRTSSSGQNLEAMVADICRNPENYKYNENENVRKNGDRVWVAWTNEPIFDSQGNLLEILGSGIDITSRKLAEEQLRQREAELSEAQSLAKLGTWKFLSGSGEIQWSEEILRMFGLEHPPSYEELTASIHPDRKSVV